MTTITVKQAMKSHPLAPAVIRQLGGGADAVQSAIEAGEHGADAGWSGFTYYKDTCDFFRRNRKAIIAMVRDMASELGEEPLSMVANFGCLGKQNPVTADEVGEAMYNPRAKGDSVDLIQNALAWFALEEVGRAIADQSDR